MVREIVVNILRFGIFLILQGVIFNHMSLFNGLALPMPYIFAMLMLPLNTPKWAYLFIGFVFGLLIDMMTDTPGMHASAGVFLGFLQPFVLRVIAVKENFGVNDRPTVSSRGMQWYLTYSIILVSLHHIWLFAIEWFKFEDLHWLLLKTVLSILFTMIILFLLQIIVFSRKKHA